MTEFSYNEAIKEINAILQELQSENCDIDTMVTKTGRAAELIEQCRKRLTLTEEELRTVLARLRPEE